MRLSLRCAIVLLLVLSIACGNGGSARQVTSEDQSGVSIRLRDATVASGESVFAIFERTGGGSTRIGVAPVLMLRQGDRDLYELLVRTDTLERYPAVNKPGGGHPRLALALDRPYRFELQKVHPGDYRLCVGYTVAGAKADPDEGETCTELTVD